MIVPVAAELPLSRAVSWIAAPRATPAEAVVDSAGLAGGTGARAAAEADPERPPGNGDGSYDSPAVAGPSAGAYQWVATYSGDAHNNSAATACNDPNEQTSIATQLVKGSCVPSPVVLRGLSAKVRTAVSVHVTALGVKSVTFYLDGRKLKTVTKSKNQRYSIKVSARGLGYGARA